MFTFTLPDSMTVDNSVRSPDTLKTAIALLRNVVKLNSSTDPAMVSVVLITV